MTSERDERLSALLDGALSVAEEAALREELACDPVLAARLQQIALVNDALRALPARPVPSDLRARLQAKLAEEAPGAEPARSRLGAARARAPARASRRRAWVAGFSAAAAAAAAALLVVVGGRDESRGERTGEVARAASERAASAPEAARKGTATASEEAPRPPSEPRSSAPEALALGPDVQPSGEGATAPDAPVAMPAPQPLAAAISPPSDTPLAARRPGPDPDPAELATSDTPEPALWVEVTDDEAHALDALEPGDAGVVAVLDWLDALAALEAEAS
jgi:negative regulator of sigma E activity